MGVQSMELLELELQTTLTIVRNVQGELCFLAQKIEASEQGSNTRERLIKKLKPAQMSKHQLRLQISPKARYQMIQMLEIASTTCLFLGDDLDDCTRGEAPDPK